MNNHEEELTLANVDEQIEHLQTSQAVHAGAATPLTRLVRDLQNVYVEERRLETAWERLNSRASAIHPLSTSQTEPLHLRLLQGGEETMFELQDTAPVGSFQKPPQKPGRNPRRRGVLTISGLVAAALLAIFGWTMLTYAFHVIPTPGARHTPKHGVTAVVSPTAQQKVSTPPVSVTVTVPPGHASTPVVTVPPMKLFTDAHFKIKFPANWAVVKVSITGMFMETVQFRMIGTSVFVSVSVMIDTSLPSMTLLLQDIDIKLGTLTSTSTLKINGMNWSVGMVDVQSQGTKLEVAISNQSTPFRLEFSAPSGQFANFSSTFQAMFNSFTVTG